MNNVEPWQEWVDKAEEDWTALSRLVAGETAGIADVIVFLCQQVAEKYLKAFLVREAVEPPYTHNLATLLDLVGTRCPELECLREDVEVLTPFAVAFRYPGMWATVDEAREAFERTGRIRATMRNAWGLDA